MSNDFKAGDLVRCISSSMSDIIRKNCVYRIVTIEGQKVSLNTTDMFLWDHSNFIPWKPMPGDWIVRGNDEEYLRGSETERSWKDLGWNLILNRAPKIFDEGIIVNGAFKSIPLGGGGRLDEASLTVQSPPRSAVEYKRGDKVANKRDGSVWKLHTRFGSGKSTAWHFIEGGWLFEHQFKKVAEEPTNTASQEALLRKGAEERIVQTSMAGRPPVGADSTPGPELTAVALRERARKEFRTPTDQRLFEECQEKQKRQMCEQAKRQIDLLKLSDCEDFGKFKMERRFDYLRLVREDSK